MKQQLHLHLNYNTSKFRICVDDIENNVVSGRVFSRRLKEPIEFRDLNSLVLRLDRLMDEQNYPQAFQRKRSFKLPAPRVAKNESADETQNDERPYMDEKTVAAATGDKATFVLQVISRQNTNWQGFVEFPDESGKREFESELGFLEMIKASLSLMADRR
jgi:hypothetical protein